MKDDDRHFRAALPEEACLDQLMTLRFGAPARPARPAGAGPGSRPPSRRGPAPANPADTHCFRRTARRSKSGARAHRMVPGHPPDADRAHPRAGARAPHRPAPPGRRAHPERPQGLRAPRRRRRPVPGLARRDLGFRPGAPRRGGPHALAAPPAPPGRRRRSSNRPGPPRPGRRPTPRAQTGLLLAAGLLGAGLASAAIVAVLNHDEPVAVEEAFAPSLSSTPPLPSLTLAAVEEDLAAARAAVESVTKTPRRRSAALPGAGAAPRPGRRLATTGDPNDVLTFGPIKVRRHLVETIVRARQVVGADPTLLMAVADKESSFATEVKAKTSSATGLYQFIERTWLGVVAEFGAKHGFDREARSVVRVSNQYTVPDPVERARILDLRREPYLSALLAGGDAEEGHPAHREAPRAAPDGRRDLPRPLPRSRSRADLHRPGRGQSRAPSRPSSCRSPRRPTSRSSTTRRAAARCPRCTGSSSR